MSAHPADAGGKADRDEKRKLQEEERREFRSYVRGIGLALGLTLVPFGLVHWDLFSRKDVLIAVGVFAFVQVVVHFRFFLHIDFSKQRREDLQLILFSALLLIIMGCGTLWIMANLAGRMTGHAM